MDALLLRCERLRLHLRYDVAVDYLFTQLLRCCYVTFDLIARYTDLIYLLPRLRLRRLVTDLRMPVVDGGLVVVDSV